jgi:hypothetical protein
VGNRLQVSHVAATAPEKFSGVPHQDATQQAGYGPQFETFLRDAQRTVSAAPTHAAPWQALDFLKTGGVPRVHREAGRDLFARLRTWLRSSQTVEHALPPVAPPQLFVPVAAQESMRGPVTRGQALAITSPQAITGIGEMTGPMALDEYPHPPQDNGRGMHWIPTLGSPPNVVDRFVRELQNMHMKWSVFLNDGTNVGTNDYLVRKLVSAGIMPVMRVYTPGLVPLEGDLESMVRHYVNLGVRYFQLYNEPNLTVETGGRAPNVNRYLDLWLPAAKTVTKAGGLPGFGALSPQGEYDDRKFLRDALRAIKERGEVSALDHAWLAIHNYTGPRPLSDPDGFLRFEQYHQIMQEELGRSLPIIGTEGGTQVTDRVSNEQQVQMVTGAYDYMRHRQPYNFAYTYWLLANEAGGGRDPEFSRYALFRPDGPSPLVDALKAMA